MTDNLLARYLSLINVVHCSPSRHFDNPEPRQTRRSRVVRTVRSAQRCISISHLIRHSTSVDYVLVDWRKDGELGSTTNRACAWRLIQLAELNFGAKRDFALAALFLLREAERPLYLFSPRTRRTANVVLCLSFTGGILCTGCWRTQGIKACSSLIY